jgi:SAM-dependent methyltransferase
MTEEFDEAYWEERYGDHSHAASHADPRPRTGHPDPSPHLVAETAGLPPGRALDAGCGEGAEAHWLAARGWRVTAVDIAEAALRRAREHADGTGSAARIEWVRADLTAWTPPASGFDLVTTHYVHTPAPPEELFARLATAVAPGGTLLLVGHHPSDPHAEHVAARSAASFTPEQAVAVLGAAEWETVVAETRTRTAARPDGRGLPLHDTVVRAHRRTT